MVPPPTHAPSLHEVAARKVMLGEREGDAGAGAAVRMAGRRHGDFELSSRPRPPLCTRLVAKNTGGVRGVDKIPKRSGRI